MSDESLICNACAYSIHTAEDRVAHYKSEWHRYNVKRRCASLTPLPFSLFNTQLTALQAQKQASEVGSGVKSKTKCPTCGKIFASSSSFNAHLVSKKHVKLEKERERNLSQGIAVVDTTEEESKVESKEVEIESVEPDDNKMKDEERKESISIDPISIPPSSTSSIPSLSSLSLSTSTKPEMPRVIQIDDKLDYTLKEGEDPIPLLSCLFCSLSFDTIPLSLTHMHKVHGFFLPFSNRISDLDSLLLYLGEKVGVGHVCVYCNSRFSSTYAVWNHMIAKSHSKMNLEGEENEEEYMDFYAFDEDNEEEEEGKNQNEISKDSENMEDSPSTETTVVLPSRPKRTLAGMSDSGELLLSDGSSIGHRQYNSLYRQKLHIQLQSEAAALTTAAYEKRLCLIDPSNNLTHGIRSNEVKGSKKYREGWWRKLERRNYMHIGMANNMQKHYRAQVLF